MEASADEVKFHLVLQAIALRDRLDVHDADIIVLHGHCELVLTVVECHGENFLPLGRRWLPSSDEVVMVLA